SSCSDGMIGKRQTGMIGKAGRGAGSLQLTLSGGRGPRESFVQSEDGSGVDAEGQRPEGNRPLVVGCFPEAHVFAGEGRREKESRRPPSDGAAPRPATQFDVRGILEEREPSGQRPRRGGVVRRRGRIAQR